MGSDRLRPSSSSSTATRPLGLPCSMTWARCEASVLPPSSCFGVGWSLDLVTGAAMNIQHLVITRLTIKLFFDSFSPQWLEGRLRLLRTYCVPSMAGQTNDAFEWLILCDEDTDPGFVRAVEESRSL